MVALFVSIIIACFRIAGFKTIAFQAAAHCWVGFLAGGSYFGAPKLYLQSLIGLTIVETVCFIIGTL